MILLTWFGHLEEIFLIEKFSFKKSFAWLWKQVALLLKNFKTTSEPKMNKMPFFLKPRNHCQYPSPWNVVCMLHEEKTTRVVPKNAVQIHIRTSRIHWSTKDWQHCSAGKFPVKLFLVNKIILIIRYHDLIYTFHPTWKVKKCKPMLWSPAVCNILTSSTCVMFAFFFCQQVTCHVVASQMTIKFSPVQEIWLGIQHCHFKALLFYFLPSPSVNNTSDSAFRKKYSHFLDMRLWCMIKDQVLPM